MKRVLFLVALSLITCISITACNTDTDGHNKKYLTELNLFIEGETADNLELVADNLIINSSDILKALGNKTIKSYRADSAYYLQIDNYMYRFQINEDGIVESYIKYKVEA